MLTTLDNSLFCTGREVWMQAEERGRKGEGRREEEENRRKEKRDVQYMSKERLNGT